MGIEFESFSTKEKNDYFNIMDISLRVLYFFVCPTLQYHITSNYSANEEWLVLERGFGHLDMEEGH